MPIAGLRMTGSAMRRMAWVVIRSADSAALPLATYSRAFLAEAVHGAGPDRRAVRTSRFQSRSHSKKLSLGVDKEVEVLRLETCESCHGTRMKDGQTPPRCATCGGTGEIRRVQQTILGQFMTSNPCPACRGEGVTITDPCPTCRGRGRTSQARKINVTVPAGIDENQTLRLSGQGEAGPAGGPAGNLFINFSVKSHPLFSRQGKQILSAIGINVAQAMLGDEIAVSTLDGDIALKIPAGTQSGQQFRLRHKGVPDMRGGERGDQIVTIHINIPGTLTEKQRDLVTELAESFGREVSPQPAASRGFFDKVKDALGV